MSVIVEMSMSPSSIMVTVLLSLHQVATFTCNAQRQSSGRSRRNATYGSGGGLTWTGAQYRFECDTVDALLRDDGRYVPRNNIALRAQICGNDLYLTYPRLVYLQRLYTYVGPNRTNPGAKPRKKIIRLSTISWLCGRITLVPIWFSKNQYNIS